jgi:hypothetical protein
VNASGALPWNISVGTTSPGLVLLGTNGAGTQTHQVVASKDHGVTWTKLCENDQANCPPDASGGVFVDPTLRSQIYVSPSPSDAPEPLWSSANEGATFTQASKTPTALLTIDPTNGTLYSDDGSNLYSSTDAGKTWNPILGTTAVKMITDPKDRETWYVVTQVAPPTIIKTSNNGTSFTPITPPLPPNTQITTLEMDGAGRLYVGTDVAGIYQSSSGGE